jgi:hypothetical protein
MDAFSASVSHLGFGFYIFDIVSNLPGHIAEIND